MKILVEDKNLSKNCRCSYSQEDRFKNRLEDSREDSREDRINTYLTVVWIGFFIGIALSLGSYYLLLKWLGM